MNCYIACLGLISYLVLGVLAKVTVSVGNDIVVKPTPYPLIDPKDKVDVVLNCNGNRSDLSYYIKNRVQWDFVNSTGHVFGITESFYQNPKSAYAAENFASGHFKFRYAKVDIVEPGQTPYWTFELSIKGVIRSDNGIYRCSLLNESNFIEDSKEVRLTVANPVETMSLEIHDSNHKVIRQSSLPLTKKSEVLTMVPGVYMVKCMASGSNPEPIMSLFLNEKKPPYVVVDVKEDMTTEFQSFMGSYQLYLTINAMNTNQNLVCKANNPGNHYDSVEAGISLMVKIDKPTIVCENATAAVDDRNSKITCRVTAEGNNDALVCDNVSWLLDTKGQTIAYDARWKDPAKEYDIIESTCMKSKEGLTVQLNLFLVSSVLFKETFFLVYGKGGNAHRHPVMLYENRPTIVCENATAAVDDRNSKITCRVTAEGNNDALVCDNVSWLLGTKGQTIAYDARWKDPAKEYDIIESTCMKSKEGLAVQLDLFLVRPVPFKETFFLVYGKGGNAHRHQVMLYEITTAAAGMATPLSLLACLVMAVLSKHLARL